MSQDFLNQSQLAEFRTKILTYIEGCFESGLYIKNVAEVERRELIPGHFKLMSSATLLSHLNAMSEFTTSLQRKQIPEFVEGAFLLAEEELRKERQDKSFELDENALPDCIEYAYKAFDEVIGTSKSRER
jgi:hypothetical protein